MKNQIEKIKGSKKSRLRELAKKKGLNKEEMEEAVLALIRLAIGDQPEAEKKNAK